MSLPYPNMLHRLGAERRAHVPARIFQLLARPTCKDSSFPDSIPRPASCRAMSSIADATEASPSRIEEKRNRRPPLAPDQRGNERTKKVAEAVKRNMRSVTSSVSIITSTDPHLHHYSHQQDTHTHDNPSFRGATVASFTTVSMYPRPLVSFNIHQRSSTLHAIIRSGYFAVNVLSQTPTASFLAGLYSRPNEESPLAIARDTLPERFQVDQDWPALHPRVHTIRGGSRHLPPKLQIHSDEGLEQDDAVMFSLLCFAGTKGQSVPEDSRSGTETEIRSRRIRHLVAGDHVIVLGEVIGVFDSESIRMRSRYDHDYGRDREGYTNVQRESLTYRHNKYDVPPYNSTAGVSPGPFVRSPDGPVRSFEVVLDDEQHGNPMQAKNDERKSQGLETRSDADSTEDGSGESEARMKGSMDEKGQNSQ